MNTSKSLFMIAVVCLAVSGCAARTVTMPSPRPPSTKPTVEPRKPVETRKQPEAPREQKSPRAIAALTLTDQAKMHLKNGQPDQAITVLERAINLNPGSGQNYYYLADAWLMKKNLAQAAECNNLAADYFEGDPSWMARVTEQKKRIQALLKSP